MAQRLQILMIPARRNKNTNPYTYLLATALERQGCSVRDFSIVNVFDSHYDVLHFHWPEHFAENHPWPIAMVRSTALLGVIFRIKLSKGKIIWTVHDVEGFAKRNSFLSKCLMRIVMAAINGIIFMNLSSRVQFFQRFPQMNQKYHSIIPHGHFAGAYGRRLSRLEARCHLDIVTSGSLIGFIGDRKRYKATETVLALATASHRTDVTFMIAGATEDEDYAMKLDMKIELAARAYGLIFVNRRLSEDELGFYVQACDALILPYREGWNSGLGLLALSYNRPIICSRLPVFVDMEDEFGANWVRICDTEEAYLRSCTPLDEVPADIEFLQNRMHGRNWDAIGRATKEFYCAV